MWFFGGWGWGYVDKEVDDVCGFVDLLNLLKLSENSVPFGSLLNHINLLENSLASYVF